MPALTKKQQKTLEFRQKQKAKKSGEAIPGDVPEADPIEIEEVVEQPPQPVVPPAESSTASKKRKREQESKKVEDGEKTQDLTDGLKGKVKDVGKGKGKAWDDGEGTEVETDGAKAKKSKKEAKQRFILFVGNLSYKTTAQDVQAHFKAAVGEIPQVRLLTTKPTKPSEKPKSRGIAFLELPTSTALQSCLKLHHSQISGRRINVELTAGGGGNTEGRKEKLKERNKRVGEQRTKRAERVADAKGEEVGESLEAEKEGAGRSGEKAAKKAKAGIRDGATDAKRDAKRKEGVEVSEAGQRTAKDVVADELAVAGVQDGTIKMRGGRRVKVKTGTGAGANPAQVRSAQPARAGVSGWQDRQAAQPPQRSRRTQWQPTGANAVAVG